MITVASDVDGVETTWSYEEQAIASSPIKRRGLAALQSPGPASTFANAFHPGISTSNLARILATNLKAIYGSINRSGNGWIDTWGVCDCVRHIWNDDASAVACTRVEFLACFLRTTSRLPFAFRLDLRCNSRLSLTFHNMLSALSKSALCACVFLTALTSAQSTSTTGGDGYVGYNLTLEGDEDSVIYSTANTRADADQIPNPDVFLNASG